MRRPKSSQSRALPMGKHIVMEAPADFATYYDGELLGYRGTRPEAEELADGYVFEQLRRGGDVLSSALLPAGV